jgi:hypothetical protein
MTGEKFPPRPSSMKSEYDYTTDPPFSVVRGILTLMVELVADTNSGAGGAFGTEAAII